MKVGIGTYCYHRFFGEVYDDQEKPSKQMTIEDFIERAHQLKVDGVTIDEWFMPSHDFSYLSEIKGMLDEYKLDRIYSWGYPNGLEGGTSEKAYDDMLSHMEYAKAIGAKVMRVIGSSDMLKSDPRSVQVERLSKMFSRAVKIAEKSGIKFAQANHSDFNADELLQIVRNVNSPNFGVNIVTGNFFRVLADPVEAIEKLAKYTLGVDLKDLKPEKGQSMSCWHFFSSTPLGDGLVDNQKIAQLLKNAGYEGFLGVELDYLHPDYNDEDSAVAQSIEYLKKITANLK